LRFLSVPNERILIVEDEEDIRELIQYNLEREGFRSSSVGTGEEAIKLAKSDQPDLMLLDLMLPGVDGLEVCRAVKRESEDIPIIMLTAKDDESDIVTGLELGADDYITKPFSPKVLVSRVKTVLRRKKSAPSPDVSVLDFKDLQIFPARREVFVDGKLADLTFTEFGILKFLAERPGWVFTRSQIVDAVRGDNYAVTDRSVDFQIVGLRKKLGFCSSFIQTVRGVGYKFNE
jgi:two-component system, OmpR family, alkaline phosphatase synthesis response regulator PhoP